MAWADSDHDYDDHRDAEAARRREMADADDRAWREAARGRGPWLVYGRQRLAAEIEELPDVPPRGAVVRPVGYLGEWLHPVDGLWWHVIPLPGTGLHGPGGSAG